jgi:hypothetical protein
MTELPSIVNSRLARSLDAQASASAVSSRRSSSISSRSFADGEALAYPEAMASHLLDLGSGLPGSDLVDAGIADLERGLETIESLLVSIGAARLARLGIPVAAPIASPEHRLYERLTEDDADSAHARYNALIRRLVSFERAAECAS